MTLLAWILLGALSGFIASKLVGGTGRGALVGVLVGVFGAFVGGGLFHLVGQAGVTGFNVWSVFVSVIGSVVVLALYHAVASRRVIA